MTASPTRPGPDKEVLAGLVERVTFHNADNGFCVLRVKARGHRDLITVIGHAATISAGAWVTASGDWVNDRTHGQQFEAHFLRCSAIEPTQPTTKAGIEDRKRASSATRTRVFTPAAPTPHE
jgi:exodeoxyribonuclease V alpha subunit